MHTYKGDRDSPGHRHTHSGSWLPADQISNKWREVKGHRAATKDAGLMVRASQARWQRRRVLRKHPGP